MPNMIYSALFILITSLAFSAEKEDRVEVVDFLQKFTEEFSQGNAANFNSYWTADAKIIRPETGEMVSGNEEVAKHLQSKYREWKGKKVTLTVGNIMFPEPDIAIVEGVLGVFENGRLVERQARKFTLDRQDGEWYVQSLREVQLIQPVSAYEQLKGLEWLIGEWKDEDQDSTIVFKTKWDDNKNFLMQNFALDVYGVKALNGMQIIGWDPSDKKIKTWVYDSDGGFGSGEWSKIDQGWSVKMNYTLTDGKKGTATNIYTKIGNKSYSYTSVDRTIAGVKLPDIKSVTVIRE